MKASNKILTVSGIVMLIGLVIGAVALMLGGRLNYTEWTEVRHDVTKPYQSLSISVVDANVTVAASPDGTTYLVGHESETLGFSLHTENGTLYIKENDTRAWYEYISFSFFARKATLYLPVGTYESLDITVVSGHITCTEADIKLHNVACQTTSGNIHVSSPVSGRLDLSTQSGNITVSNTSPADASLKLTSGNLRMTDCHAETLHINGTSGNCTLTRVTVAEELTVKLTSGNIHLTDCHATSLYAEHTSGNCSLTRVTVAQSADVRIISGNITLDLCDAQTLHLESTSGNVSGTLLSPKQFNAASGNGRVECPPSSGSDTCYVRTGSGNIHLRIAE